MLQTKVRWLALSAALWTVGYCSLVQAQVATPNAPPNLAESLTGQAKIDYDAARVLYTDGDAASALVKFDAAYQSTRDPRLLWNLAACYKQLRQYAEVEASLKRYLAEGGTKISEADRQDALALLQAISPFLADATVVVSEPDAAVSVDDKVVGQTPLAGPVRMSLGEHRLKVQKAGFAVHEEKVTVAGGAAISVNVTLRTESRQGALRVITDDGAQIRVDGAPVGTGVWSGVVPSGPHLIEIQADGKLPYRSDVAVADGQTNSLRAILERRPTVAPGFDTTWLWVTGSVVLAATLGVGAYYLLEPQQNTAVESTGNLPEGRVTVNGLRW